MIQFLESFLPNLAATVIGLVVGVPFALWVNRRITAEAGKRQEELNADELAALVQTVHKALVNTGSELSRFQNLIPGSRTGPRLLDSGTWDALKGRLSREFGPPELVRRLAFYWLQLGTLNRLHRDILESEIRGTLSGMPLSICCDFRNSWARDLSAEATGLSVDLVSFHERLLTTTAQTTLAAAETEMVRSERGISS